MNNSIEKSGQIPEVRIEEDYVKAPTFKLLENNNLNCMNGFANFLDILRKMPENTECSIKKSGTDIHITCTRPYPDSSGILYRRFQL